MRTIIPALLLTLLMVGAATAEPKIEQPEPAPSAPYYTTLAEAQQAAAPDQKIVIEFYTDW